MKRGIVISTIPQSLWLGDLLKSLANIQYPIYIHLNTKENNSYELGAIQWAVDLGLDEFVYLQDTLVIKNKEVIDMLFAHPGQVSLGNNYLMYLGKYNSDILKLEGIPKATNKDEAIQGEIVWAKNLAQKYGIVTLFPDFTDGPRRQEKYGRMNMVIENDYVIKYKNCWDLHMAATAEKAQ